MGTSKERSVELLMYRKGNKLYIYIYMAGASPFERRHRKSILREELFHFLYYQAQASSFPDSPAFSSREQVIHPSTDDAECETSRREKRAQCPSLRAANYFHLCERCTRSEVASSCWTGKIRALEFPPRDNAINALSVSRRALLSH